MKKIFYIFSFSLFLMISNNVFSRAYRVNQIPNGNKYQCLSCHVGIGGGGQRNLFGETVNDNLTNGNVRWDLIFNIDSDGDGFTNGEELQDPNGEWVQGEANPGEPELVTQQWNPDSKPTTSNIENDFVNKNSVLYPIPTNGIVNLEFISNYFETSNIQLFNNNGIELLNKDFETTIGINLVTLSMSELNFESGMYFINVKNKYYTIRKKIIYSK